MIKNTLYLLIFFTLTMACNNPQKKASGEENKSAGAEDLRYPEEKNILKA
ncbi:MAG: hypothetical protein U5L09_02300 [Bacteroidales bacterium]|nr:hypothetical protein [Bacteroidales bacterium]